MESSDVRDLQGNLPVEDLNCTIVALQTSTAYCLEAEPGCSERFTENPLVFGQWPQSVEPASFQQRKRTWLFQEGTANFFPQRLRNLRF